MASGGLSADNEKLQDENAVLDQDMASEPSEQVLGQKVGAITPATTKDKKDIQQLLEYWHNDILDDTNLKQTTLLGPFKKKDGFNKDGWRLDSQSNGPFVKFPKEDPNTKYQNFAIQWGKPVYSCVIAPLGQNPRPAPDLIIQAYNKSVQELKVAVIKRKSGNTWEIVMEK